MELSELQVNVRALMDKSARHGWGAACLSTLSKIMGVRLLGENPIALEALPKVLPYSALRAKIGGCRLLDLVECLEGTDGVRTGGVLLLAMSNTVFMPHVPAEHPARKPAEALLDSLQNYLLHGEPAEIYIGEAFRFRSAYGTSHTALGTDPDFELLFEALPANGLDCAIGEGCWDLTMHWQSFGLYLASRREGWKALSGVVEDLAERVLVADDSEANRAAFNSASMRIQDHMDAYVEQELEAYDPQLEPLVDGILASLFAPCAQAK